VRLESLSLGKAVREVEMGEEGAGGAAGLGSAAAGGRVQHPNQVMLSPA